VIENSAPPRLPSGSNCARPPEPASIRRLVPDDLGAYKELRDSMLAAHPEAFTSDAATERMRPAGGYLARLGMDRPDGGQFTLGAWHGGRLVGTLGCERDMRVKVMHIAHLIGMMVRADVRHIGVGTALLDACIHAARSAEGIAMLTLTVTAGNGAAIRLYERAGFIRFGSLPRAILVGGQYHAKEHMVLTL
jgi:RimJ/RimL family protein N-acetyltransferase